MWYGFMTFLLCLSNYKGASTVAFQSVSMRKQRIMMIKFNAILLLDVAIMSSGLLVNSTKHGSSTRSYLDIVS